MGDTTSAPGRSSRRTLSWGGAGVALASLFPLLSNAGLVLPSIDVSWVYTNTPLLGGLSAVVLIAAFVVLAVGLPGETGIAGSSLVGRSALVLFAVAHTTSTGYVLWPTPGVGAGAALLAVWSALVWGSVLLSLLALAVAAVAVFRAGVVRGPARWALPALAVTMVVALLASLVLALAPVWIGALVVSQLVQLATGVLFVVGGQRARRGDGLRVASA